MNKTIKSVYRWDIAIIYCITIIIILFFAYISNEQTKYFILNGTICVALICELFFLHETRSIKIDNGFYRALAMSLYVCISVCLSQKNMFILTFETPFINHFLGIVLFIFGIVIRVLAFKALKGGFSYSVTLMQNQKLITKGIYKVIRHPAYLGTLFYVIGIGVIYPNYIAIVVIVLFFPITISRIKKEENLLISAFGSQYIEYMSRSKKFIPFIY